MGKVNLCLKIILIIFNAVFGIIGWLMIAGLVKTHGEIDPSVALWCWLYASAVVVSMLGIHAVCNEKVLLLKISAGLKALALVGCLVLGFMVHAEGIKIRQLFDDPDSVRELMLKLSEWRDMLDIVQSEGRCCGLASARDWGDNIPDSCSCSGDGCIYRPQGSSGPVQIYGETCGRLILDYINPWFQIVLGFLLGFAAFYLLEFLLFLLMIKQVRRADVNVSVEMKGLGASRVVRVWSAYESPFCFGHSGRQIVIY